MRLSTRNCNNSEGNKSTNGFAWKKSKPKKISNGGENDGADLQSLVTSTADDRLLISNVLSSASAKNTKNKSKGNIQAKLPSVKLLSDINQDKKVASASEATTANQQNIKSCPSDLTSKPLSKSKGHQQREKKHEEELNNANTEEEPSIVVRTAGVTKEWNEYTVVSSLSYFSSYFWCSPTQAVCGEKKDNDAATIKEEMKDVKEASQQLERTREQTLEEARAWTVEDVQSAKEMNVKKINIYAKKLKLMAGKSPMGRKENLALGEHVAQLKRDILAANLVNASAVDEAQQAGKQTIASLEEELEKNRRLLSSREKSMGEMRAKLSHIQSNFNEKVKMVHALQKDLELANAKLEKKQFIQTSSNIEAQKNRMDTLYESSVDQPKVFTTSEANYAHESEENELLNHQILQLSEKIFATRQFAEMERKIQEDEMHKMEAKLKKEIRQNTKLRSKIAGLRKGISDADKKVRKTKEDQNKKLKEMEANLTAMKEDGKNGTTPGIVSWEHADLLQEIDDISGGLTDDETEEGQSMSEEEMEGDSTFSKGADHSFTAREHGASGGEKLINWFTTCGGAGDDESTTLITSFDTHDKSTANNAIVETTVGKRVPGSSARSSPATLATSDSSEGISLGEIFSV